MKVYYHLADGHKTTRECFIKNIGIGSNNCIDCEFNIDKSFNGEVLTDSNTGKKRYTLFVKCEKYKELNYDYS